MSLYSFLKFLHVLSVSPPPLTARRSEAVRDNRLEHELV